MLERKGGSVDYATSLKGLRAAQIAKENKLPTINLVESGVNLNDQDKIFNNAGATFREITKDQSWGFPRFHLYLEMQQQVELMFLECLIILYFEK